MGSLAVLITNGKVDLGGVFAGRRTAHAVDCFWG